MFLSCTGGGDYFGLVDDLPEDMVYGV
jgi:hypothetical protein